MSEDERSKYTEMERLSSEAYLLAKTKIQKPVPRSIQTRIELKAICSIVEGLNELQKQAVIDIGFGGLLKLRCKHIDHEFYGWLLQKFDPTSRSLKIHGGEIILKVEDVHYLLGLQCRGSKVELATSTKGVEDICKEFGVKDKVVSLKVLKTYLSETNDAGIEFKRKFALYILGAFLCPTTKAAIHERFINLVKNVEVLNQLNWAKFTLDFLVDGIYKWKGKKQKDAPGCLFLLMVYLYCLTCALIFSHL